MSAARATRPSTAPDGATLDSALEQIARGADALDRQPGFPSSAFALLAGAGILGLTLPGADGRSPTSFGAELDTLRAVARADGSVGRILDGHFNAVERLAVAAAALGDAERRAIAAGELLLGVWGADPTAGEGEPATLVGTGDELTLRGAKTFCSGAGGVQRALVVVRDHADDRRLAYVDVSRGVELDRSWYRGEGLRASESHLVRFDGARVLALLGGPNEILREPWFSRDALRTGCTWAGIADSVVAAALEFLRARGAVGDLEALCVGRMQVGLGTIDRWLDHAAERADAGATLDRTSVQGRYAIAAACREILAESARACGSRPLAIGGALSRGRRDLDLFLLQHRLDPLLARQGRERVEDPLP
jgi:alkylation response protein AidB-like acyl-CoA dehydrogenase